MFDYQNKIQFFVPRYPRLTFSLITYTYLKKKNQGSNDYYSKV